MQLFKAHHSFLWRKWYIIPYMLLVATVIFAVFVFLQSDKKDSGVKLGVVDLDQTTETAMILTSVQKGEQLADGFSLRAYEQKEAMQQLKAQKIDGYIVLERGMTNAFYKNGALPIKVVVYDAQSLSGVLIQQLTQSIYDRLMISEAGILTYGHFYKTATDDEIIQLMLDLLATALNRTYMFQQIDVAAISTLDYYTAASYMIVTICFFMALLLIFHMNTKQALMERLQMYRAAREKMILTRYILAYSYTLLFAFGTFFMLGAILHTPFEWYNASYALLDIWLFVTLFSVTMLLISLLVDKTTALISQLVVTVVYVVSAGLIIPLAYIPQMQLAQTPFAMLFEAFVQLWMRNYIVDLSLTPYIFLIILLIMTVMLWRRKVTK